MSEAQDYSVAVHTAAPFTINKLYMITITPERRELLINELEHRIAHNINYRKALIEESLQLSSSSPRKSWLQERARQFAQNITNLESRLYELYAQRVTK